MSVHENLPDSRGDVLVGTLFADFYQIISVLGKGGMSVVYKANYVPLDQFVAVKVMHAHMAASPALLQRFKQEAKLCSALNHPNIVRVLRLQIADNGFPFLVAEFLEGRTIQTAIQQDGPFSEERFRHVFSQVLDALEYAHAKGIVHRDIKPSNVILIGHTDNNGNDPKIPDKGGEQVKIVDFGISKMLSDSAAISQGLSTTTSGNIFGTAAYMSPEQCTGGSCDARSDIYSVACVMYEALTGKPAFGGDTALDTMFRQVHDQAAPFAEAAPDHAISDHLEAAIFAALKKDPGERPQSIAELRATLTTGQIAASTHVRWRRAKRLTLGLLAVAALAAAVGALLTVHRPLLLVPGSADGASPITITGSDGGNLLPAQPFVPVFPRTAKGCLSHGDTAKMHTGRPASDNWKAALRYYHEANRLLSVDTTDRATPHEAFRIKQELGVTTDLLGHHQAATPYLQEALAIGEKSSLDDAQAACAALSANYRCLHRLDDALKFAKLSVKYGQQAATERAEPWRIANLVQSQLDVALCYRLLNQLDREENAIKAAIQTAHQHDLIRSELLSIRTLCQLCNNQNRNVETRTWLEKYFRLESEVPLADREECESPANAHELYAIALKRLGDLPGAQREYETACQLISETYPQKPITMKGLLAPMLARAAACSYLAGNIAAGDSQRQSSLALYQELGLKEGVSQVEAATKVERAQALQRIAASGSSRPSEPSNWVGR